MYKNPKVAIYYRSKSSGPKLNPYQAGGLASNALHSLAVLLEMGVTTRLEQVLTVEQLAADIDAHETTHAIVEALWVKPNEARALAEKHPYVQFVYRAHSKMGFLQVEPEAITTMRELIELGMELDNVFFSSNNLEFAQSIEEAYGGVCLYLPNLYDLVSAPLPQKKSCHVLKIASFGATRLLKLHPSAALAALQISERDGRRLEFYINTDKTPGGDSVRRTMRNMFAGLQYATLHEISWQDTQDFKETIASMDLVLQLSATETFCMVAADAVASGVPVVVGPAITWVSPQFQAPIDDTSRVAEIGDRVLRNEHSAKVQLGDLKRFIDEAKEVWARYLGIEKKRRCFFF